MASNSRSTKRNKTTSGKKTGSGTRSRKKEPSILSMIKKDDLFADILVVILAGLVIMMLLSMIGKGGVVGKTLKNLMFGLLGFSAWVFPFYLIFVLIFAMHQKGRQFRMVRIFCSFVLYLVFGILCEIHAGTARGLAEYDPDALFKAGTAFQKGGGLAAGTCAWGLLHVLNTAGTLLVLLVITAICLIIITRKSPIAIVGKGVSGTMEAGRDWAARNRERREERRARMEEEQEEDEEEEAALAQESVREEKKPDPRVRNYMDDYEETIQSRRTRPDDEPPLREPSGRSSYTGSRSGRTGRTRTGRTEGSVDFEATDLGGSQAPADPGEDPAWQKIPAGPAEDAAAVVDAARRAGMDRGRQAGTSSRGEMPRFSDRELEEIEVHRVKEGEQEAAASYKAPPKKKQYTFPPYDLLEKPVRERNTVTDKELQNTGKALEEVLKNFKVDVTVTDICRGPSVTRYELRPGPHITVSAIKAREADIALNLGAASIRMEAPIPGKHAVGIEVPNDSRTTVTLREILESREFIEAKSHLTYVVGKDITGRIVVSDIAKMPHLLIAGATGAGKSVCLNSMIVSILYKASPAEVKFIMIDPKMVELSIYDGIPHLLLPVVTDAKKAAAALQWACAEMDNRYSRFLEVGAREISSYNRYVKEQKKKGVTDQDHEYMPRIVVIVDELADLMTVASKEVETAINRLAAKARAAGIHLVIATQRPSVDVITGVIKANMPSRIAFMTSSAVDSKTILDTGGAEKLLGYGDMLFAPASLNKPLRIQGAFIDEEEAIKIAQYIRKKNPAGPEAGRKSEKIQKEMDALEASSEAGGGAAAAAAGGRDPLFEKAGRAVITKQKATIGSLQRELQIGFNRAARIMDQLADEGVVSSENATKARKVLMTLPEFEALLAADA
jgi:S-DNA-T family DNA segregation ATPase FtsK/SpoIIIE